VVENQRNIFSACPGFVTWSKVKYSKYFVLTPFLTPFRFDGQQGVFENPRKLAGNRRDVRSDRVVRVFKSVVDRKRKLSRQEI